jgi:Recombinase zinc beta ribbon domain/Recombinase
LTPGRQRRHELGLPHGGRVAGHGLYGYAEGERKGTRKGLLTWTLDEEKAQHVRDLFALVDATDVTDLSLRGLARDLEWRHVPTATREGNWSAKQVYNLLRNGKYAGLGRNYRYTTGWGRFTDEATGEVYETPQVKLCPTDETYAVPATAIPPIVDADQFLRVQAKLDALHDQHNRGGPRRTDPEAHATLLDGFAFCAHCGGKMTRYWDRHGKRQYQCNKRAGTPMHPCKPHQIRADAVDELALKLFATVLTDPEKILELADAAEQQYASAVTDVALADAELAAHRKRLAEIAAEQEKLRLALHALNAVPGMDEQIAGIRAKLDALDQEREEAEAHGAEVTPQRERAAERQVFLQSLFLAREVTDASGLLDLEMGATGGPYFPLGRLMAVQKAAVLLGIPESEIDLPRQWIQPWYAETLPDGTDVWEDVPDLVLTADVVRKLLLSLSRDQLRRLLANLDAVVLVSRPRSRAEWAVRGKTPVAERVALRVLGTVEVRMDAANLKQVLVAGQAAVGRGGLRHIADGPAHLRLLSHDVEAGDRRAARGGRQQGRQLVGRALARAIGAEQAEDFALLHGERNAVDGGEVAEALGKSVELEDSAHMVLVMLLCPLCSRSHPRLAHPPVAPAPRQPWRTTHATAEARAG